MKIERHETGPRMSKAVIHGETVYLAGIVADGPKGKSVAEQTRSILAQIDGFLAMAGTDKTKLLSANIWITDMADFAEMNTVWDAWVSPGNTPARATVEAKLASPDYRVDERGRGSRCSLAMVVERAGTVLFTLQIVARPARQPWRCSPRYSSCLILGCQSVGQTRRF